MLQPLNVQFLPLTREDGQTTRRLEGENLISAETEGWSELLVAPALIPQPTLLAVAVAEAVLPHVDPLPHGLLPAHCVLHHVTALSLVEDGLGLG